MECNKEEAIRAKEMAEKRMGAGDFLGAKKIALKAQKLYPETENIIQLLTVCDIHCSALNKINGSDMDWYGILQVEKFSDDASIKKQYRRLAFLLHPDKNKFAGAEAAFKLIGEANRVLTDCTQRLLFDTKLKHLVVTASTKRPIHQPAPNAQFASAAPSAKFTSAAPSAQYTHLAPNTKFTSSGPYQQAQQATFWTLCCFCCTRFQYYKECLNQLMHCSRCQRTFTAYDLGPHVVHRGYGQSDLTNQKVASQGNRSNCPGTFVKVDQVPKAENLSGGNVGEAARPKESGTSNVGGRKRRKKSVKESDDGSETTSSSINEDMVNQEISVNDTSRQPRRSSRRRQDISYKENVSDDDDDFAKSPTLTRGNSLSSNTEEKDEATLDDGVHKDIKSNSSADAMAALGKDVKQKVSTSHEESSINKESGTGEDGGKDEDIIMSNNDNSKSEDDYEPNENVREKPVSFQCPDPEFGDFDKDKAKNCFAVNQIWAIYDQIDGMPRFYAVVKKLFKSGFRLQITWLEPVSDEEVEQEWCDSDLPVACGKYVTGSTEVIDDILMLSHQICVHHSVRGSYFIYPKKGETWALFKNWSMKWKSDPKKHKSPYQFEHVEILSDFVEKAGIGVCYLKKVEGFVSLFDRTRQLGVIPRKDLYKFSHRVPSFKMTGKEKDGVPPGSFELDPASLLLDFGLGDPAKVKRENESLGAEAKQTS